MKVKVIQYSKVRSRTREALRQRKFSITRSVIVIVVFFIIPFSWGSFMISGGDYFHYVYPSKQISSWLYLWDYQHLLGSPSPNNACALFPFLSFLATLEFFRITPQLCERIWIVFILFAQYWSMYYLLGQLDIKSKNAKFVSSIFYVINPATTLFLTTIPSAIQFVVMPLSVGLLIDGIAKKRSIYFVLLVIVSFLSSNMALNPAVLIAAWIPFIYYLVIKIPRIKISNVIVLFIGFLSVNAYWIVNLFTLKGNVELEQGVSWTAWTSANSSLLNILRFQGFWAWGEKAFNSPYFPYAVFYNNKAILAIWFCIIAITFFGFFNFNAMSKSNRSNLNIFVILFLLSSLAAKGLHEPLASLNIFVYEHVPFSWMFRTPWPKFMPIVVLALIVNFSYSCEAIEKRIINNRKSQSRNLYLRIMSLFVLLLVFIFNVPYFTGAIFPGDRGNYPGIRVKNPNYWNSAAVFANSKQDNCRILLLPENPFYQVHYFWPGDGYYGIDPAPHYIFKPLVFRTPGGGFTKSDSSEFIDLLYEEVKREGKSSLASYMKMANIGYILHRNDFDWTQLGEIEGELLSEPKNTENIIDKLSIKSKSTFGRIRIKDNRLDQYFSQNILRAYPYMKNREALSIYGLDTKDIIPQIYATTNEFLINGTTKDIINAIDSENLVIGESVMFLSKHLTNTQKKFIGEYDKSVSYKNNYVPQTTFQRINPTKYKVHIESSQPFFLVFSESYDSRWKAYIEEKSFRFNKVIEDYKNVNVKEAKHEMKFDPSDVSYLFKKPVDEDRHYFGNGYANAWFIDPDEVENDEDGEITITILFKPQNILYIGFGISLFTIICCLGIIFWQQLYTRKVKFKNLRIPRG